MNQSKRYAQRFLAAVGLVLVLLPAFGQDANLSALQNYRRGRELESNGRQEDATRYYNEAIRICNTEIAANTANRDTYVAYAYANQRLKRYSEVITWGNRGLLLYPSEYRIMEIMGEAYLYMDNYDACLRSMQRYVNGSPEGDRVATAYFFIGEVYRLTNKYRKADIAYTTAVTIDRSSMLWWYRLGQVRESAEEYVQAIEAFEQTLRLSPNYRDAGTRLVRIRSILNG
ncbi:tetratricopeptide repeat protein [Breznakiellaceae bacterium SP9]